MFQRILHRALLAAAFFLAGGSVLAAQFTPGNLAVVRMGGDASHNPGGTALGSATAAVFIDEFTATGSYVQTFALPTAVSAPNFALTLGGTATSEGELNLSTDGRFLTLVGYNVGTGVASASASGATSATVNRTVGVIRFDGLIDTSTALTDFASANNARGAFSTNGASVWLAGADASTGGVRYIAALGVTTSVNLTGTALKNTRDVAVFNGQLYFASDKGGSIVEALGAGLPTSGTQALVALTGSALVPGTNSATNSFFFTSLGGPTFNGFDTLYVADDATTATSATPGISKYSFDGTNWNLNGTIGGVADAYEGLTGTVNAGVVTLYATKPGSIVSIVDSSGFAGAFTATPASVATAPVNTAFRGIAFAPQAPGSGHITPAITGFSPDVAYGVSAPPPSVLVAPNAAIVTNASNFNGGSLTISFTNNGVPEDQLGIITANQITLNGPAISYAGSAIGTFAGGTSAAPLAVTFTTASATPVAVQALLRSIFYKDTAAPDAAVLGARTVQAVVNDGTASNNLSAPVSLHINVANLNNKAPVLTVPAPQATPENVILSVGGISVADPDAGTAAIVVTLGAAHGTLSVQVAVTNGVAAAGITGNFSKGITLSAPQAAINATLAACCDLSPGLRFQRQ